jgi:glucose-6-phosphate dehydrogenase assembly protein OpcA
MTTTAPASGEEPVPVALPDIERELAHQLKAVQAPQEAPVRRACMSNLVIYCDRKDLAERITTQMPAIVAVHPARVLLLVGDAGEEASDVTATVSVRTRKVGAGRTLCSEQITLHGCGPAIHRLPYVVRGLLIGDLPANLWWAAPQPPPLAGPLLYDLAEHAQQVVYDSLGWLEPAVGVTATAAWIDQSTRDCRP